MRLPPQQQPVYRAREVIKASAHGMSRVIPSNPRIDCLRDCYNAVVKCKQGCGEPWVSSPARCNADCNTTSTECQQYCQGVGS